MSNNNNTENINKHCEKFWYQRKTLCDGEKHLQETKVYDVYIVKQESGKACINMISKECCSKKLFQDKFSKNLT